MMGTSSGQIQMILMDISELIPENHLLKRIDRIVSFSFIYELLAPYYPSVGRPSIDPVSMFKMLLIGYLYGIKSERRLVQCKLRWLAAAGAEQNGRGAAVTAT